MTILRYIHLYSYLTNKENLSRKAAMRTIFRIRKLPQLLKLATIDILDGFIPDLTINNVSLEELINRDGMKPIRAVLFLDWVNREPRAAMQYMVNMEAREIIPELTEEAKERMTANLERLKKDIGEKNVRKIEEQITPHGIEDNSDLRID